MRNVLSTFIMGILTAVPGELQQRVSWQLRRRLHAGSRTVGECFLLLR